MNNKEAIKEIKNLKGITILDKTINFDDEMVSKKEVLYIIEKLDDPEKLVVPQFVADWYEDNKDDFENKVYDLCVQFNNNNEELNRELRWWFECAVNKPFETLVKMKLFGYDVEKEKQYVVVIPDDGRNGFIQLWKNREGKLLFNFEDKIKYGEVHLLTEQEIKQKDERLWKFAEEAEDEY